MDANHGTIREALRATGIRVFDASKFGGGFPDLICSLGGFTMLVEVKDGKGTLTSDQVAFIDGWQGCISIVRDLQGVETVYRFMRKMSDQLKGDGNG